MLGNRYGKGDIMCLVEMLSVRETWYNWLRLTTSKTVLPFTKSPRKQQSTIQDELNTSLVYHNKREMDITYVYTSRAARISSSRRILADE